MATVNLVFTSVDSHNGSITCCIPQWHGKGTEVRGKIRRARTMRGTLALPFSFPFLALSTSASRRICVGQAMNRWNSEGAGEIVCCSHMWKADALTGSKQNTLTFLFSNVHV